ncbi:UDP-glycosyltransferase 78D2 [Forsythia ovata]|uniref:UDP-glycosyltransferase 78D2 n=1 Tax=Forsythia ovata TaxID=205694 RepID=A0ABD1R330_9LAMI
MGQVVPQANALCINSFEELEPTIMNVLKSKFNKVLNIGPVSLTSPPVSADISDEHGCIPWLDKHDARSVVYIGFGNVASPTPDEVNAIAEALEASKIPFLWSLRVLKSLPLGFLERTSKYGKIVNWAPQVKILAHSSVGVSINHCGWNSVMECIAAGVPIIGRPFLGDNYINSWMIEKVWGIGVRIKGGVFTKDETAQALELVLFSEEGKKMKEQIESLKELVYNAVGPNGSSTENFKTLLDIILK